MTSTAATVGKISGWRAMAMLLLSLSLAPVARADGEGWGFPSLMQELAINSTFTADFSEQRSSMFLARPITLSGVIEFDAATRMRKEVREPFTETIVIDEQAVVINRSNRGGRAETEQVVRYSLANYPFLAKAIRGVSNLFAGDMTLLEELYTYELSGSRDDWTLLLEPKAERLAEFITYIRVRGSGGEIREVHTLEADGDESNMVLSNRVDG